MYIKFAVANLGETTSAALDNPAKVISWCPFLAGQVGMKRHVNSTCVYPGNYRAKPLH